MDPVNPSLVPVFRLSYIYHRRTNSNRSGGNRQRTNALGRLGMSISPEIKQHKNSKCATVITVNFLEI